jgi:RNA polymerase sigma-70 factor (ECF subfamily)
VRRIYRYAFARLRNGEDAEDVCAQTFAVAFQTIDRYQGRGPFAAWITAIARNLIVTRYRTRQPLISLDSIDDVADHETRPDHVVSQRLEWTQLLKLIQTLPPDQAEVVHLRIFAELSTTETARLMSRSEAAVKMLLHRALQALRTHSEAGDRNEVDYEHGSS